MPELVTVPLSFFELTVDFERPDFRLWIDRADIVQGVFDALAPWNPTLDDVEPRTTGKPSEQGVNFRLPLKRISFFFGPAYCKFSRDDTNWEMVEETISILDAALSALLRFSKVKIGIYRTAIALHLQPRTLPFMDILKPLLPTQLEALENAPVSTMAVIAKWHSRKVTIDGSGAIANGVFLRMERDFESSNSYRDIAEQLRKDEEQLFRTLGLEEDRV